MKKLLILLAASALFAACSSDDAPANETPANEEGTEQGTPTEISSFYQATTEDGLGISVGTVDDANAQNIAEGNVYFDLIIPIADVNIFEKGNDIFAINSDDFAIRVNGEYHDIVKITNAQGEEVHGNTDNVFKVSNPEATDALKIRITGLEKLETEAVGNDYTFETYLWVNNTLIPEEGGEATELFSYTDKLQWIGLDTDYTGTIDEPGIDLSSVIKVPDDAELHDAGLENEARPEYGYDVRYNVYRGIQGNDADNGLGDTPYIKVSIHVYRVGDEVKTTIEPIYIEQEN